MLISVASVGVFNLTAGDLTSGDFEFSVKSNKAIITKYKGSATKLTIPSKLGGYPVVKIGKILFTKTKHLKHWT